MRFGAEPEDDPPDGGIGAGRGDKAERRLPIPIEEFDRAIVPFDEPRSATMSEASSAVLPGRSIDDRGRAILLSDEEVTG